MASKKMLDIKIDPSQIMHVSLSKSKNGYNYASLAAKISDNEYMNVGYEWQGENVPDFAMDVMGFVKANEKVINESVAKHKEEYAEFIIAKKGGKKGGKKGC